jgi:hypothetical protein
MMPKQSKSVITGSLLLLQKKKKKQLARMGKALNRSVLASWSISLVEDEHFDACFRICFCTHRSCRDASTKVVS